MKHEIILAPEAIENFKRLSARHRAMVHDGIERHLRHQPHRESRSRIKRLRGLRHPQYRLRIDEIRLYYDIVDDSVEILAILPKSKAAAWLKEMGEEL